ncbi:lysophospholipase [Aggregatilineales bacterium SYSU G02658]
MYASAELTTRDGLTLHYHTWTPNEPPRALVFIVHGIGEHGLRYDHVGRAMAQAGYLVIAPDHRGHGRSGGPRTFFASFDQPVADLRQLYEQFVRQHRGLPVFLYGHSMGSGIALKYALAYQSELRGLILTGTVITLGEGQPAVSLAAVRLLGPRLPMLRLVPSLPTDTLSTDAATVRAYEADPLVDHQRLRVGMVHQLIELGRDIRSKAHRLAIPLLVMHGEDDQLTPISGAHFIHREASTSDKTLRTYPGLRHELVNERGREAIIQEMIDWLNKH